MRKILCIFSLILSLLILGGCSGGNYKLNMGNVHSTSNSIYGSYQLFDGYYFQEVKLKENEVINFYFDVTTISGTLNANIYLKDNLLDNIQNESIITISKSSTYRIKVIADHHEGSFTLIWVIN